jgi:hypothetical protein
LIYYPDAKPGTKAILVEQPEPLEVGLWPFIVTHRRAIRADGRLVDLHGDEREVDDSKPRAGFAPDCSPTAYGAIHRGWPDGRGFEIQAR